MENQERDDNSQQQLDQEICLENGSVIKIVGDGEDFVGSGSCHIQFYEQVQREQEQMEQDATFRDWRDKYDKETMRVREPLTHQNCYEQGFRWDSTQRRFV